MKRKLGLLMLIGLLVLSAGTAWADSEFYVIAGGGGAVGTKITSVPYTITQPGFYYLGGNLIMESDRGHGITLAADDVTIDLMGFRLAYTGTSGWPEGIRISGHHNVEIRNGTVSGWYGDCISGGNGTKCRVINIRAFGSHRSGIWLSGSNHLIKGCISLDNTATGLYIASGIITDSVACNNGNYGIYVLGPGSVIGNFANNNSMYNFYLGNGVATSIMVDRNTAFGKDYNNYYIFYPGTTGVVGLGAGTTTNAGVN